MQLNNQKLQVDGRFYYITFIMDAFSRYIVGYNASNRLLTDPLALVCFKHNGWRRFATCAT